MFWICEYQTEVDVLNCLQRLNHYVYHGVVLQIFPAINRHDQLDSLSHLKLKPTLPDSKTSHECEICHMSYRNFWDFTMHLYVSHRRQPIRKTERYQNCPKFARIHPKKEPQDDETKEKFNAKTWSVNRPYRNPDYVAPYNYSLDMLIGIEDEKSNIGFVPMDHLYAKVPKIIRGSLPNSLINGPQPITYNASMFYLVQQHVNKKEYRYVPIEHSYGRLETAYSWCSVCGRRYSSVKALNEHLPVHFKKKGEKLKESITHSTRKRKMNRGPKEEIFTCKMCSLKFYSKTKFIAHVTSHETDLEREPRFKCIHCNISFPSDIKMIKHQLLHECEQCNETFPCVKDAQVHRDSHFLSNKAKCCCELCGDKFLTLREFQDHLFRKGHPITKQARDIMVMPEAFGYFKNFKLASRSGEFHCMKCSKVCNSDVELYSHMGFHFVYDTIPEPYKVVSGDHKDRSPVKVRISLAKILGDHHTSDDIKEIISSIPKTSAPEENVSQKSSHKLNKVSKPSPKLGKARKSAVKIFKCPHCDKRFAHEIGMKDHLDKDHSTENKENEDFSGDETENSDVDNAASLQKILKEHKSIPEESSGDDLYERIQKRAKSVSRMIKHSGVSDVSGIVRVRKTAAKLFKCKVCDIKFGSKRILAFHKQQHAEGKIKAPRKGPTKASFSVKSSPKKVLHKVLKDHRFMDSDSSISDIGSPGKRKLAKKTFGRGGYECDICSRNYRNHGDYIAHIKTHTQDDERSLTVASSSSDEFNDVTDDWGDDRSIADIKEFDHVQSMVTIDAESFNESFDQPADTTDKLRTSICETKTCNICDKKFSAWSTICAHILTHPEATYRDVSVEWKSSFNPKFQCRFCDDVCHSVTFCYLHYKYHVRFNDKPSQGTDCELACCICQQKFDKIGTLHTHMKVHVPRVGFGDTKEVIMESGQEKCHICHRIVTVKSKRRHFQIHTLPIVHICEECDEKFPNQEEYVIHYYHNHFHSSTSAVTASAYSNGRVLTDQPASQTAEHKCEFCRSTFLSRKSRRNHEYKHKKGVFKFPCQTCTLHFQSSEDLYYHIDNLGHAVGPNAVPCSECDARFLSKSSKTLHEKVAHKIAPDLLICSPSKEDGDIPNASSKPIGPSNSDDDDSQSIFSQPMEIKTILNSSLIKREPKLSEQERKKNGMLLSSTPSLSSPPFVRHPERKNKKFTCEFCDDTFYSFELMQGHMESCHQEGSPHNPELDGTPMDDGGENVGDSGRFNCPGCDVAFPSYSDLLKHEEEYERVGSFQCMECGLIYKTKHKQVGHECNTKTVTKQERTLPVTSFVNRKCHACNKSIPDKESFKYHIRKHWYRCYCCHYDFSSKKGLRAHLKLQKCVVPSLKNIDQILHTLRMECLLCTEEFKAYELVETHFLCHTIRENGKYDMFLCLICGVPFKIIEQLRNHMKTEICYLFSRQFPEHVDSTNCSEAAGDKNGTTSNNDPEQSDEHYHWGCPFCSNSYDNYKSAWSHIRSYHKLVGKPFKVYRVPEAKAKRADENRSGKVAPSVQPVGKATTTLPEKQPAQKICDITVPELPSALVKLNNESAEFHDGPKKQVPKAKSKQPVDYHSTEQQSSYGVVVDHTVENHHGNYHERPRPYHYYNREYVEEVPNMSYATPKYYPRSQYSEMSVPLYAAPDARMDNKSYHVEDQQGAFGAVPKAIPKIKQPLLNAPTSFNAGKTASLIKGLINGTGANVESQKKRPLSFVDETPHTYYAHSVKRYKHVPGTNPNAMYMQRMQRTPLYRNTAPVAFQGPSVAPRHIEVNHAYRHPVPRPRVQKCMYCHRIFRNDNEAYHHMMTYHVYESSQPHTAEPFANFNGRMYVWRFA